MRSRLPVRRMPRQRISASPMAIASGLAFTFALPARNVTVRRLVPQRDIEPAFAIDSVSYNLGRAVAPPLSVLLVTTLGFGWAFAANAVSFIVFALCLMLASRGRAVDVADSMKWKRSGLKDGFVIACCDWQIAIPLLMVAAVTVADDPVLVLGPALARPARGRRLLRMVHRRARRPRKRRHTA